MMSLELPGCIEPHLRGHAYEHIRGPATYALTLERPENLALEWDCQFDHRPPYFKELQESSRILYVGAAKDLLARLTDHKDGEKRLTVLTEVCSVRGLWGVDWKDSAEEAFERESGDALALQQHYSSWYVHSR